MIPKVDINIITYVSNVGSLLFLGLIIELVRKKKIAESFSLIWLGLAVVFVALSFWREGLDIMAKALGIGYAPSALFLVLLLGIILLLIQFSVLITKFSRQNTDLAQEIGILKLELEQLKGRNGAADSRAETDQKP